ncbi:MAG: HDOD domain-containing protein [Zetaproteobacteria bacterium]|nr:HDOD domain-containing protein [Zetaproteobacteria bacterium]
MIDFAGEDKDLDLALIKQLIDSIHIPSPPQLLLDLRELLQSEDADPEVIASMLGRDSALAAKTLTIVNSPLYKLKEPVSSIARAAVLLGPRIIQSAIISSAFREMVSGLIVEKSFLHEYWRHSLSVAEICKVVAERLHAANRSINSNDAYLMGLFHDAGMVVLMVKDNQYLQSILRSKALYENLANVEAEDSLINHADVAYFMSKSWGLSGDVRRAIRYHHGAQDALALSPAADSYLSILIIAEYLSVLYDEEQMFGLEFRSQQEIMAAMQRVNMSIVDLKKVQATLLDL